MYKYIDDEGLKTFSEAVYTDIKDVGSSITPENLLPYPYVTQSSQSGNVTYTSNEDGSVTVTTAGTASAARSFYYQGSSSAGGILLENGKTYTASGMIPGGDNSTYTHRIGVFVDGVLTETLNDNGEGVTFTTPENGEVKIFMRISVQKGYALNTTIYPMLEVGTLKHDYQPYNLSRQKLRADIDKSAADITSLDTRVTALEQGGGGNAEKLKYKNLPLIKYSDAILTSQYGRGTALAMTKNFIFVLYLYTYYTPKYNAIADSSYVASGTHVPAISPNLVKNVDEYTIADNHYYSLESKDYFYREVNGVIVRKTKAVSDVLYNLNYYFYTNGSSSFCSKEVDTIVWRSFTDLIPSLPSDVKAIIKGFAYSDSTDTSIFLYSASENKIYEILNFSSSNMLMYTYSLTYSISVSSSIIGIDGKLYTQINTIYTAYEFNRDLGTCTSIWTENISYANLCYRYGFIQNKYGGTVFRIDKGKKKLFRSTTIPIFTDGASYTQNGSSTVASAPRVDFDNLSYARYTSSDVTAGVYYPTSTSANTLKYHYYLYYMEDPDYE